MPESDESRAATVRGIAALVCWFALTTLPAQAHVRVGRVALAAWMGEADWSVVAELVQGPRLVRHDVSGDFQQAFRVRVLETLSGHAPGRPGETPAVLEVASHAEGLPAWQPGDHALLFLERSSDHAGMGPAAAAFEWVTLQGPGDEWTLPPGRDEDLLPLVRAWATPPEDPAALLAKMLGSGWAPLRGDAVARVVTAPGDLSPALVAAVAGSLDDAALSTGERVALISRIQASPDFDAAHAWQRLAGAAREPRARADLARLVVAHPEAPLGPWLRAGASHEDPVVRRASLAALAVRPGDDIVGLLSARALHDPAAGVAREAIRGLASRQEPGARAALRVVEADESIGADRRRWAAAALRRTGAAP